MDRPVVFGMHDHLVGVVNEPASDSRSHDVGVVMMTAGMLHHVGPFRMHVDLAKELSDHGLPSIRFDLSGIGESFGVGSSGESIDRAAAEAGAAMDMMANEYGCQKFILFGLCSGADDSMHTAIQDHRVRGFVAIDGCGYRTNRFYWHRLASHYLPRLLSPNKWAQLVRRSLTGDAAPPTTLQAGTDVREFPSRREAVLQFKSLVERGTRMHFVYTGGIAEYYNYENQFYEMLPDVDWNGMATTKFFGHMDHVALLCEDREQLVAHVAAKVIEFADSYSADSAAIGEPSDVVFPSIEYAVPETIS